MYLCLHILAVLALILVPRLVPKIVRGVSSESSMINGNLIDRNRSNGSIANVLKRATPLTNSVSNHHD